MNGEYLQLGAKIYVARFNQMAERLRARRYINDTLHDADF